MNLESTLPVFSFAILSLQQSPFEQFKNLQWFHSMCLHNSEIIIDTQPIASIEAIYVFQTTFSLIMALKVWIQSLRRLPAHFGSSNLREMVLPTVSVGMRGEE